MLHYNPGLGHTLHEEQCKEGVARPDSAGIVSLA